MAFRIENPTSQDKWDSDLSVWPSGSFFHTAAWAAVLVQAYRYRPVYIAHYKRNRLTALLPVMETDSFLTGKRGVSLPFTDACSPLADSDEQLRALIQFALRYAVKHRWRSLTFRTERPLPFPAVTSCQYLYHRLDLRRSDRAIERKVRKSTLRNVRQALRAHVSVRVSQTLQSIREFYKLNCLTRKRHGLPPQPWYFFRAVHEKIIAKRLGHVFIAHLRGKPIAASIFFHFRNQVYYKYGASDLAYQQWRPNNLVMWEALQHYRARGCVMADFGRTEVAHNGLRQFKRGWGADEDRLYYYKYNTKRRVFMSGIQDNPPGYTLLRKMPVSLLRLLGHLLYPHIG